ncbi:unnamed protein product [Caenorhabditis auriculariae]|uniref:Transgelin n=1 Tax=Caenorhabditis auriculariae TaxID=2777116 RepID=A0A8S1HFH9_9PELO|nr:unnamed protein product [Caenorhabditis auriculariae]
MSSRGYSEKHATRNRKVRSVAIAASPQCCCVADRKGYPPNTDVCFICSSLDAVELLSPRHSSAANYNGKSCFTLGALIQMANHGPSYGLSRELQKKNEARFVLEEAIEVLSWIEQMIGEPFAIATSSCANSEDVCRLLKDGIALCKLMQTLDPTAPVAYNRKPKMPFHMMENISNFLEAVKKFGVMEISCFQTVDLYENKQCYKVIECLRSLATVAQARHPHLDYPPWVVKLANSCPRKFPVAVIRRGEMVIPLQYGTNKCASQKGMSPYGLPRQIKPDPHG